MRRYFPVVWLTLAAATSAQVSRDAVLAKMDDSAASFRSLTGKIRKLTHTAVINDDSTESGTVCLKRQGKGELHLLVEIGGQDPKSYSLRGRKAEIFYPKIQTVQEYNLGQQGQLLDQFLLLGFGTPTREMLRSYTLRVQDEETVAGEKTVRVELVPKASKVRQHLSKAELWISLADGHTVQQKFYEPSGDYRLATYSEIKWNPSLPDSALALKLPANVKREFPQR
ncbi:MAG: hypothetical protein HY822_08030 [Acidobacteria bacterium]|nr:hypothetical protein [Acidobacteriota bacterium]